MKYFSNIEIPESQRPFYPYVTEQSDGTRLVLRKNASPRVAVSLSLLLLNVTGAIAFASWTYFAVAVFFFGMFIVDLLEGSECQLTVESTAVTGSAGMRTTPPSRLTRAMPASPRVTTRRVPETAA